MSSAPPFASLEEELYHQVCDPKTNNEQLIARIKAETKTLSAAQNMLVRLRRRWLDDPRTCHPDLQRKLGQIVAHGSTTQTLAEDLQLLKQLGRMTQRDIHAIKPRRSDGSGGPFKSPDLNKQLAALPLLPESIATMLPTTDQDLIRKTTEHNLRAANRAAFTVYDVLATLNRLYRDVLQPAAQVARNSRRGSGTMMQTGAPCEPHVNHLAQIPNKHALAASLLFVSGRRTAEICNGASRFTPGHTPYSTVFHGQVKSSDQTPYEIPLLIPYADFVDALAAFRATQGNEVIPNSVVNKRFASRIGDHCSKLFSASRPLTPHDLRRLYAKAAYQAYGYGTATGVGNALQPSFMAFIEAYLGHAQPETALHYANLICEVDPVSELQASQLQLPTLVRHDARRSGPVAAEPALEPLFED